MKCASLVNRYTGFLSTEVCKTNLHSYHFSIFHSVHRVSLYTVNERPMQSKSASYILVTHFYILSLGYIAAISNSLWPDGTTVFASSVAPPERPPGNGTFAPELAIDGDMASYWCDATNNDFPDILYVQLPQPMVFKSLSIMSVQDNHISSFEINGLCNGRQLELMPESAAHSPFTNVTFPEPVECGQIGIRITGALGTADNKYSRINELIPEFLNKTRNNETALSSASMSSTPPTSATSPAPASNPSPPAGSTSQTTLPGIIIGGVACALIVFLAIALASFRIRRRRRRGQPQFWQRKKQQHSPESKVHEVSTGTLREELIDAMVRKYELEVGRKFRAELTGSNGVVELDEGAMLAIPQNGSGPPAELDAVRCEREARPKQSSNTPRNDLPRKKQTIRWASGASLDPRRHGRILS